jgi:hypothetical protein
MKTFVGYKNKLDGDIVTEAFAGHVGGLLSRRWGCCDASYRCVEGWSQEGVVKSWSQ